MAKVVIPAQKLVRRFSTRIWIAKFGVVFSGKRKRKKKGAAGGAPGKKADDRVPTAALNARIEFEIQQRRVVQRQVLFEKLYDHYIQTMQVGDLNNSII